MPLDDKIRAVIGDDPEERIRIGRAMKRLVATPEWKVYTGIVANRSGIIASNLINRDTAGDADVYAEQREKGALRELSFLLDIPHTMIREMAELIASDAPAPSSAPQTQGLSARDEPGNAPDDNDEEDHD